MLSCRLLCWFVILLLAMQGGAEPAGAAGGVQALPRPSRPVRGGPCLPGAHGEQGYVRTLLLSTTLHLHPSFLVWCTLYSRYNLHTSELANCLLDIPV